MGCSPRRLIALSLLAVGVALRVRQYAACPSYWYDEAYLLLNVFARTPLELLGPLGDDQAAPPLFLWVLRGLYRLAGGSEWSMRLPALAAGVAGLLVMVPLARRLAGRPGWPWAVAFCALGHHAAAHSAEVKPYTVDFLATELVLLAAVHCLDRAGSRYPSPPLWGGVAGISGRVLECGEHRRFPIFFCPARRREKREWQSGDARRTPKHACQPGQASPRSEKPGPPTRGEGGRPARVMLCIAAVVLPWASYPAVFVLGAASLALLLQAVRRGSRSEGVFWAVMTGLLAASGIALYATVVRHQATPALRQFWASSFLDLSSPSAALSWVGRCLVEVGNYGTREMGLPLLVLAAVGGAALWRRSPPRVVLLAGPLALALAAAALRRYPLGGRLLFFLVPCLWLLAARGVGVLTLRLPARPAWLRVSVPALLLIPAALWAGRLLVTVTPRAAFREAFAHVERERRPGDAVWVSHPQVYEVYHGRRPGLSSASPPEVVERQARAGRLWMVCAVAGPSERFTAPETVRRVRAAGVALSRRRFKGLEVVLYAPAERGGE